MKQPEAKFKKKLTDGFEEATGKYGWWTYVIPHMGMKNGIPDLFFAWCGRCAWFEAKVGNNPLSSDQKHMIECMLRAGSKVISIRGSPSPDVSVITHQFQKNIADPIVLPWIIEDFSSRNFWMDMLGRSRTTRCIGSPGKFPTPGVPKSKEWKDR